MAGKYPVVVKGGLLTRTGWTVWGGMREGATRQDEFRAFKAFQQQHKKRGGRKERQDLVQARFAADGTGAVCGRMGRGGLGWADVQGGLQALRAGVMVECEVVCRVALGVRGSLCSASSSSASS